MIVFEMGRGLLGWRILVSGLGLMGECGLWWYCRCWVKRGEW